MTWPVKQNLEAALQVADRIACLENGAVRHVATPEALTADALHRYLGVRSRATALTAYCAASSVRRRARSAAVAVASTVSSAITTARL